MSKQSQTPTKQYKIRLKKGDLVIVRAGKHKGKTGKLPPRTLATTKSLSKVLTSLKRLSNQIKRIHRELL